MHIKHMMYSDCSSIHVPRAVCSIVIGEGGSSMSGIAPDPLKWLLIPHPSVYVYLQDYREAWLMSLYFIKPSHLLTHKGRPTISIHLKSCQVFDL